MSGKRPLPFEMGGQQVQPGCRADIAIPAARLYTNTPLDIVARVVHGKKPGPQLLVCSAVHGDEINGVEICRRLLKHPALKHLRGTLIVVPIINLFGFTQKSRYLPDRRDLNRSFPGSERGTLASRMASRFTSEILSRASHVIDLHTGAIHRSNLPHIRVNTEDTAAFEMAQAFRCPVILDSKLLDGSLRETTSNMKIPYILFEAGEALRFEDRYITAGIRGILNVMRHLNMIPEKKHRSPPVTAVLATNSFWVRSTRDGVLSNVVSLGQSVSCGEKLATIVNPLSNDEEAIYSTGNGIVIGATQIPLVHEGEALFHIASFDKVDVAEASLEAFEEANDYPPLEVEPGLPS
ncbi:MAG: succinylglutamate desuccinylase/aspartoacylase family protein [Pseudomonadales bacterium]|nr:succinylglutamate desuccinylase/aspartoacylase family protein [Pseudomonadales bacterium]